MKYKFNIKKYKYQAIFLSCLIFLLAGIIAVSAFRGNITSAPQEELPLAETTTIPTQPTNTTSTSNSTEPEDEPESEPEHIHAWTIKTIQPTCEEDGYILNTCSCGETEKTNPTKATGHSYGEWEIKKEPSLASEGVKERQCISCQKIDKMVIEKLVYQPNEIQSEMLRLVNEERANHNLPALKYYGAAQEAADIRAHETRVQYETEHDIHHTRPNGDSWSTVLDGIELLGAGENICAGLTTVEQVEISFMNSTAHRENILNPRFTHLAVGEDGVCWAQLFLAL
ncbi:MAG: hypothetical protein IJP26_05695 [Clostridia bacterium]|nr:hypothetical protein [Clostridia bacterium]